MDSELRLPVHPARINIGLLLDGEVLDFARRANRLIAQHGGEFAFEPSGIAIPHITFLMGDVGSDSSLTEINAICADFASTVPRLSYTLSSARFADERRRYVFADVREQAVFLKHRRVLQARLASRLKLDHHGGPSNPSHITLGFIEKGAPRSLLRDLPSPTGLRGKASILQIALTGRRGTCVRALATHQLSSLDGAHYV